MLKKDQEYILWLCKRLVFKYKEDPKILVTVSHILEKNDTEMSFFKKTHKDINENILLAIKNLTKIHNDYNISIENTKNQFFEKKIDEINNTFENIDIKKYTG